jgi:hypothetical protein
MQKEQVPSVFYLSAVLLRCKFFQNVFLVWARVMQHLNNMLNLIFTQKGVLIRLQQWQEGIQISSRACQSSLD